MGWMTAASQGPFPCAKRSSAAFPTAGWGGVRSLKSSNSLASQLISSLQNLPHVGDQGSWWSKESWKDRWQSPSSSPLTKRAGTYRHMAGHWGTGDGLEGSKTPPGVHGRFVRGGLCDPFLCQTCPSSGDTELCRSIKSTLVDYLTDKYSDPATSDLLDMATFVEPRFKEAYIPRDRVDALKQKVVVKAKSLLAEGRQPDPAVHTLSEPADQAVSMAPHAAKKKKSLASFFKRSTVTTHWHSRRESEMIFQATCRQLGLRVIQILLNGGGNMKRLAR